MLNLSRRSRAAGMPIVALASAALLAPGAPPGVEPDAASRPGPASQPTDAAPAAAPATHPSTRPVEPIRLTFEDAPLEAVLDHLSEAAGFIVVKEVPVEGRVTVISRRAVTPDEAVVLLNTVLASRGVSVVRNGRVLKIVGRDAAMKGSIPVYFGADPQSIPASDSLITQVIPVANVDAVKLRQDLAPLIGKDADVAANSGANAIVITDAAARIRRVAEIIAALDRHEPGDAELRRYALKNADASAAARLIATLLTGAAPQDRRRRDEGTRQPEPPSQGPRGRVTAVADDRTNTLFVSAGADALKVIDGIIADLEANPAAASEVKIFSLKHAEAASAARLITAIFRPDQGAPRSEEERRRRSRDDEALHAEVVAAADERTNTLVVTAPAATVRVIEQVLDRLDADPASTTQIKVFPLIYADATSAARLITSLFRPADVQVNSSGQRPAAPSAPGARVTAAADERTNSLIVTASPEALKTVEEVLAALDANPAAASEVKSIALKNADASSAAYLLSTLFNQDAGRVGAAAPAPGGAPLLPARGRLTAAADSRTNTVLLQAPAELLAAAEGVLRELDQNPATQETLFIYRLRNGQAARVEQTLNVLFGNVPAGFGGGNFGGAGNFSRGGAGRSSGAQNRLGAGGIGSRLSGLASGRRGGFGGDPSGGAFGGNFNNPFNANFAARGIGPYPPNLSQGASRAITQLTGEVFVVADEDTNSLLVTVTTKYLDQVKQVIAELDRPVPQVLIKVLVAEVTHDDSVDIGVDFSILNQRPTGNGQIGGTNFGLSGANAPSGGLVVQALETNVNATLRALQAEGKLDVLSRPYILASDNQLASITVGNEVPFITNSRITDQGQQINTIEYQDVGIILNVVPHINPDGLVILDVVPEISQLTSSTVPVSAGVTAPVIAKRSAASRVGINNGNTIVIGGLMEDRKTETVSKVPILGDLPLIGPLFSRTQMSKTKTELLIFLTPHVAPEPEALAPMSRREMEGVRLAPMAVEPGAFQEQIRGLQIGPGPSTRPIGPVVYPLEIPIRPQPFTLPTTRP